MKEKIKRIISAAAAGAVMAGFCGCGEQEKAPPRPEYVYKALSAEYDSGVKGDINGFCSDGSGKICFLTEFGYSAGSEYREYHLNFADAENPQDEITSVKVCEGREVEMSVPCFNARGNLCWASDEGEGEDYRIYIRTADLSGSIISEKDITETVKGAGDSFYISMFGIDGGGNYILANWYDIIVLDSEYNLKCHIKDAGDVGSIVFDRNKNPYIFGYAEGGLALRLIDTEKGEIGSENILPVGDYGSFISPGTDSDFLICTDAVYKYDLGGEATEVFGLVSAGISVMEVNAMFGCGEDKYIFAGKSYPYEAPKISLVTKQPAPEKERKEIVLSGGSYAVNAFIMNEAVKFNSQSDDFYITVKTYSGEDYSQMNMDIISGKIPDILISDSYTPIDSYISKGMLADLYELMDSDSEISRSDFLPSLLGACENDGRLYRFTDSFMIYTVLGKQSIFGDKKLTFDSLREIASKYPDGTEVFPACTKSNLLMYAMEFAESDFIDYKSRECSFNSEQFINMLKYSNELSDNINLDDYFDEAFWDRFDTMFSDESALLMTAYITDFKDFYRYEKGHFAEPVCAVGFPCEKGSGTAFNISTGISISAKSDEDVRQGAWEFVKRLLGGEYQNCVSEFPVRNDALEKRKEAAKKRDPDKTSTVMISMGDMTVGSTASDIDPLSEKELQRVMDIIDSADCICRYDSTVTDIISEEASAYYSGIKTAEEAAELIQMRVQLYLNEQG